MNKEHQVQAVSFDVTGTLIHSPRRAEIYAEVLARHGLELEVEAVRETIHQVWQEFRCLSRLGQDRFASHPEGARGWWGRFVERVCEHLGTERPSPFAVAELFHRFAEAEAWEVYEDAKPALDELRRRGFRLAAVSNWDQRLPELLERLDLNAFFERVVVSCQVGVEKPHPRIFELLLEALELPPHLAAHVGDDRREDQEGAMAAGMKAFHLDRSGRKGDLASLAELPDRLAWGVA